MSELFDKKALTYRSREKIKCAKYQKGMEDGYILRFYEEICPSHFGAIICNSLEQALGEMQKPTRERLCWKSDNTFVSVVYEQPVPIVISHKHTEEEYEEMADAGLLPFSIFIDDTESEYVFEEITEENCWIIKNLINGSYFTASTEFMQEYELLEGLEESNNGN